MNRRADHQRSGIRKHAPIEDAATPGNRPRVVYAQDDRPRTAGAERLADPPGKRPDEPARILVVEDDFLVAMQVEAALGDAGFALAGTASSADEAVALAASHRPTLIVMDIRLAGTRDGVDAALEIHRALGLRCVFASAHADPEMRRRAAPAEPLGWLQKPYSMFSLIEAIRHALTTLQAPG